MDSLFKKHNVIFAHCFSATGMAGNTWATGKTIYQRIDDVLNNKFELSCSTIKENDTVKYMKDYNIINFCGPVGIILRKIKVTYANPDDGGTRVITYRKRDYILDAETTPNSENIEKAIVNRLPKRYNEFCTDDYEFYGLFLCFDNEKYLMDNIISETMFYNNTKKHGLKYFNLNRGFLSVSEYNNNCFEFIRRHQVSEIY